MNNSNNNNYNPLKRKLVDGLNKKVASINNKDKRLLVEKIMQVGILGYSNRNKSLYKDKISSFKSDIGKDFKGLEISISGRIRGARRARGSSVIIGRVWKNSLRKRLDCNNLRLRTNTGILGIQVNIAKNN